MLSKAGRAEADATGAKGRPNRHDVTDAGLLMLGFVVAAVLGALRGAGHAGKNHYARAIIGNTMVIHDIAKGRENGFIELGITTGTAPGLS